MSSSASFRLVMRWMFATLVTAFLAACSTTPDKSTSGLRPEQEAALRAAGFVQADDGSDWTLALGGQILFQTAEDRLNQSEHETIVRLARTLSDVGIDAMTIEGHTDDTGPEAFNQALSERRAAAVARAIHAVGIPYENLVQRGFGSSRPIADNARREGRAHNRRVTIIVPAR